jgi:hypothetical protein
MVTQLCARTIAAAGVSVTAIDTPGLHASSDAQSANRSILKGIKRAYKARKPHFVLYVDRWVGSVGCVVLVRHKEDQTQQQQQRLEQQQQLLQCVTALRGQAGGSAVSCVLFC